MPPFGESNLEDPWTLNIDGGNLYVVDYDFTYTPAKTGVVVCKIDEATGALSNCALTTVRIGRVC